MASKRTSAAKPSISIVGPGSLGSALAIELARHGYPLRHIVRRPESKLTPTRQLARRVKAQNVILGEQSLDSDIVWLTVPDDAIAAVAQRLAATHPRDHWKGKTVFHSSGALTSDELAVLKRRGASVASVHPMMTFVNRRKPQWRGVSFAIEGEAEAVRMARRIAAGLGGIPFAIEKRNKVLYHAFGAFASPLVIALMSASEQVAEAAGIPPATARKMMQPLLWQTLENYASKDAASAFSGPVVRGDVKTVRKHLAELKRTPAAREVYIALSRLAIRRLPTKDRKGLERELVSQDLAKR